MKVPIVGWTIDERFLMHRLRSTSFAGFAAVLVSAAFFFNDLLRNHVIRWDLFSIIATAAVVKMSFLLWYRFND